MTEPLVPPPTSPLISSHTSEIISSLKDLPRASWDEYFISTAFLIATRSPSHKLRVGAIITENNRIIAAGYNGFFSKSKTDTPIHRDGHEINTIHAEQNAITDAAKRGVSTKNTTIYVTHYPCIHCTKFIIAAGIKHIKYYNDYKNDTLVPTFLHDADITIEKLEIFKITKVSE